MKKVGFFVFVLFISCNTVYQKYDFGEFTIEGPTTWKILKVKGVDSFVREIITQHQDTLYLDYGYYSNSLEEQIYPFYDEYVIKILVENGYDEKKLLSENARRYEEAIKNRKERYELTTIDGFKAKIAKPKQIGEGITGVYFDSLSTGSSMNVKLNFLGVDLNAEDQQDVLKAIKTIQFKK